MQNTPATTPLLKNLTVKILGLAAEVVEAEALLESLQSLAAESLSKIGVGAKAEHRLAQRWHIAGGDKEPRPAILDDLRNAPDI